MHSIQGFYYFYKKSLTKLTFNNSISRKILESIIYPIVIEGINRFKNANMKYSIIFKEVPLVVKPNFDQYFSPKSVSMVKKIRLFRLKTRLFYKIDLHNKIDNAQVSQGEKYT